MKKLIYGVLSLAIVGIGVVGCKKEKFKNPMENSLKSGSSNSSFYEKEGVLVFNSWDDIVLLEEKFKKDIEDHMTSFESNHQQILTALRVPVNPNYNPNDPIELTWESELAVDSFERSLNWKEEQPLIDFENQNNFLSLRKKIDDLLYSDSESDEPSKLSEDQRLYLNTFPINLELSSLFNEDATIGVGDSLFKVLGNNFWIQCHIDEKHDLEKINDYNYASYEFDSRFIIYGLNDEKSTCRSNRKLHDSKVTTPVQNYKIYSMMTITNVFGIPNGHYIKGRTICEIKNNKGKWKRRKTFCRVTAAAKMRPGTTCQNELFHSGWFDEQHPNKSCRTKRYYNYPSIEPFRIRGGEFASIHEGGVGTNKLTIYMTMN